MLKASDVAYLVALVERDLKARPSCPVERDELVSTLQKIYRATQTGRWGNVTRFMIEAEPVILEVQRG